MLLKLGCQSVPHPFGTVHELLDEGLDRRGDTVVDETACLHVCDAPLVDLCRSSRFTRVHINTCADEPAHPLDYEDCPHAELPLLVVLLGQRCDFGGGGLSVVV